MKPTEGLDFNNAIFQVEEQGHKYTFNVLGSQLVEYCMSHVSPGGLAFVRPDFTSKYPGPHMSGFFYFNAEPTTPIFESMDQIEKFPDSLNASNWFNARLQEYLLQGRKPNKIIEQQQQAVKPETWDPIPEPGATKPESEKDALELPSVELIHAERIAQIERRADFDDEYRNNELRQAAACYLVGSPAGWPTNEIRNLTAEIDRLLRATEKPGAAEKPAATEKPGAENQRTISDWADETFGPVGSNARVAARANEEMAELLRALTVDDNNPKAADEVADIMIVLCRLATRLGVDIYDEIDRKMAVNRKREWKLDNTGHGYHVGNEIAEKYNQKEMR